MDLIYTEVTISIGFFILLVGMSLYGLFMTGVALAVAFANLWHRDLMFRELRRYNAVLSQADKEQHSGTGVDIEIPHSIGSPIIAYGDREFLEDRD